MGAYFNASRSIYMSEQAMMDKAIQQNITIDLAPSWEGVVLVLAEIWVNQRSQDAKIELTRMARIADEYVALKKGEK